MQVRSHVRRALALCDLFANPFHLLRLQRIATHLQTVDKSPGRRLRLSLRFFLTCSHFCGKR